MSQVQDQEWTVKYVGEARIHHVFGYYAAKKSKPRIPPKNVFKNAWLDGYDQYFKSNPQK